MSIPIAKHSFTAGELSPSMMGRQDTASYQAGATTARNVFVRYTGGHSSRAGTAFVGYSKQTGRAYPPRPIEFQFSSGQALTIEFGHFYARFISQGAYVTETPLAITAISQASPAQVTLANLSGVATAAANNGAVASTYAPGDTIALAGGTSFIAAVLTVGQTTVHAGSPAAAGIHYVPGDTIVAAGGSYSTPATFAVSATQVVSATVAAFGSGGTNGTQTVTGTTGTGTKFQATVTVAAGQMIAVLSISVGGAYSTNPANIGAEPVTGGGLTGAQLSLVMGVQALNVSTAGVYGVNPAGGILTQASTSGSGTGATFNGIFAPYTVSVTKSGQYTAFPANPVAQGSTSGIGFGATFNLTSLTVSPSLSAGDWLYFSGISGMGALDGETFVANAVAGNVVTLADVFGNTVDTTGLPAYASGGTAARIYTVASPYNEVDLPYIKFVESADAMSLCCVNPTAGTEYPPQDLIRASNTSWSFTPVIPTSTVAPPTGLIGTTTTAGSVNYQYVVTSISTADGTESVASAIVTIPNAVDIAATAGTITTTWTGVGGVGEYYVYKALPAYGTTIQAGAQFGFAGITNGASFADSNIQADFTRSPPTRKNPFARGAVLSATPTLTGSGYTSATLSINTSTGSGAVLRAVINSGAIVAVIVDSPGQNYAVGDSVAIAGVGGSGASISLTVGPQSGTYPSVPAYFQQRRGYANSLNNPDTYWFSKPGAYGNFDVRVPPVGTDAITGSPWAVQVNGVQWMIQTSGGLLVMTGLRAWMLVGAGSAFTNVQPITPAQQDNVPQAFSGCSPRVSPILVNYDLLYVDPNNVYWNDLPFQIYALSEPIDLTDKSEHLFTGYNVVAGAYCEKPYRLVWSVRSDGALLSLTYYKTEKVQGWTRHDTQGSFVGCCSVLEPPVNALYLATQRYIGGQFAYMMERMDNRIWRTAEDTWAVDCGVANVKPTPAATLSISSAAGLGSITGGTIISGGSGYSAQATAVVSDQFRGAGVGAVATLTIVNGVITGVAFAVGSQGSGYTQPMLTITDPAGSAGGSGANIKLTLNNATTLSASAGVFSAGSVGSVVRALGGIATITAYTSPTQVTANVLMPFVGTIPNTGGLCPPVAAGNWTMTAPTTIVTGLRHLAGATVTGLADGNVITPRVVSASGQITLDTPASAIVVGLGFKWQFQDVPLDTGQPTIQAQRKKIAATSVRMVESRGVKVGANQRDGSMLNPAQLDVPWSDLVALPESGNGTTFPPKPYNAICTPLLSGDARVPIPGGLGTMGQLCLQGDYPLPFNLVAFYDEVLPGDTPQMQAPPKEKRK